MKFNQFLVEIEKNEHFWKIRNDRHREVSKALVKEIFHHMGEIDGLENIEEDSSLLNNHSMFHDHIKSDSEYTGARAEYHGIEVFFMINMDKHTVNVGFLEEGGYASAAVSSLADIEKELKAGIRYIMTHTDHKESEFNLLIKSHHFKTIAADIIDELRKKGYKLGDHSVDVISDKHFKIHEEWSNGKRDIKFELEFTVVDSYNSYKVDGSFSWKWDKAHHHKMADDFKKDPRYNDEYTAKLQAEANENKWHVKEVDNFYDAYSHLTSIFKYDN